MIRTTLTFLAAAASLLVPALAHAQLAQGPQSDRAAVDSASDPFVRASLGYRAMSNLSKGFDPYAASDRLAGVELSATVRALRRGPFTLAAGLSVDAASREGSARGAPTTFDATHLALVAEGRWRLHPGFTPLLRVAPGLYRVRATLTDAGTTTSAAVTPLALDLSAGAAILLGRPTARRAFSAWFVPRVGYVASTAATPSFQVDDPSAQLGSPAARALPPVAIRGPYVAFEVAVAY